MMLALVLLGFLALRSELVRALERQQRTESFWVSVFVQQDPVSEQEILRISDGNSLPAGV